MNAVNSMLMLWRVIPGRYEYGVDAAAGVLPQWLSGLMSSHLQRGSVQSTRSVHSKLSCCVCRFIVIVIFRGKLMTSVRAAVLICDMGQKAVAIQPVVQWRCR